MTENEARQKWCPFVRVPFATQPATGGVIEANIAVNRPPEDFDRLENSRCIASDCMAWRFAEQRWNHEDAKSEPDPESGYCGLAGKP